MSKDAPPLPPPQSDNKTKKKKRPITPHITTTTTTTNGSQPFGVMGVFLLNIISLFFFCSCFFVYVDRTNEATEYVQLSAGKMRRWFAVGKSARVWGIGLVQEGGECDFFDGKWVWDDKYPLYKSKECGFLDQGFRCSENGRPDRNFTHWRWQPHHCNLPRFDAVKMLDGLRNKRVVFVGDSIGRNQWESLLCMLSTAVSDKTSIYEVNGSEITKHTGYLVFRFRDYNCTVEYYRAPFLVLQSRPPLGSPEMVATTLKLDTMDWSSPHWTNANLLVFNSGHWWNHEKTIRSGCYFEDGGDVKMEMSVEDAYKRSIDTLLGWVRREVNTTQTHVIFRTYSAVHFRSGDWKTGGSCHLEVDPIFGEAQERTPSQAQSWTLEAIDELLSKTPTDIDVLNVTRMTEYRKDGHSSIYYLGPGKLSPLIRQDCSHWCLPGVPDSWNEILYGLFMQRRFAQTRVTQLKM